VDPQKEKERIQGEAVPPNENKTLTFSHNQEKAHALEEMEGHLLSSRAVPGLYNMTTINVTEHETPNVKKGCECSLDYEHMSLIYVRACVCACVCVCVCVCVCAQKQSAHTRGHHSAQHQACMCSVLKVRVNR